MSQLQGAIAATRFGMGARPGEIDAAASDPRGWLKAQFKPDAAVDSRRRSAVREAGLRSAASTPMQGMGPPTAGPPGRPRTGRPSRPRPSA